MKIIIGGFYMVNKNKPSFADLIKGELVRVVDYSSDSSVIVTKLSGEDTYEWWVDGCDLDIYCLNKGGKNE